MASVKSNVLLNGINTVVGIIFPIITFPYAARVLLPEGIGTVNFLNSIVSYIVLLTSVGIPLYAVKEIAKYRDDIEQRNRITIEILILSISLCLIGYVVVWALAAYVPQIHKQSSLFYILSLTIVFTGIGVNWFYQGVEDFKYITIRGIIFRTLSAASLFIFVKTSQDLLIYGCILVGSTVGSNILNFVHLKKYINFNSIKIRDLSVSRHIKPSLQVFVFNLITSLYIQLNSVMLGFMSGDNAVGFFSAGTKMTHIGLTIITSLGVVLLPRCANLIKSGDIISFKSVVHKSLSVTLALSLPMTIGLMVLAKPITLLFCGNEYYESIYILVLNAPVIIFISLTNLMGMQILYPMDKINIVIWSVSGGAIVNLLLNLFLIPYFGAVGAAVATLFAEFMVLFIQIIYGKAYYPFKIREIINVRYIMVSAVMGITVWLSVMSIHSNVIQVSVGLIVGVTIYITCLYMAKDSLINELSSFLRGCLHIKHN